MAYGLKYSQYTGGGTARVLVQVYVKDWAGASYGMAHLTGAALQVVGGQSDVTAPLIKTAFSFSLVDAWDEGTTAADGTTCVNAMNEKCGEWEEFFTPDATKFRVVVSAAPPGEMPRAIWTGYVTPDSWSEDLVYHGSVTITARDMLGSLQDAEFNLTGRVSVLDIVAGALSACSCPMPLLYAAGHFLVNASGVSLLRHNFVASTFAGENWYTALEKTLESLGLVLRWNGQNKMVLTSLRYLADDTQRGYHAMQFINRSGLRELSPALRSITEVFDVEAQPFAPADPDADGFTETGTLTQHQVSHGILPETRDNTTPGFTLTAPTGGGWSGTLGAPRYADTLGAGVPARGIYFPTDIVESVSAVYSVPNLRGPFVVKFTQDGPLVTASRTNPGSTPAAYAFTQMPDFVDWTISKIIVRISCKVSGTTYYYATGWQTTAATHDLELEQEFTVPALEDGEDYAVAIVKVETQNNWLCISDVVLAALTLDLSPSQGVAAMEWKTTTQYDPANNVTITRDPAIGSATIDRSPLFYTNVLAYGNGIAEDGWNWPGEETFYPLAVMIQAQILCFYAAPASVFTGTARDGEIALPGWGLTYFGRDCVLVSGTYDFCGGFLAQMNAREVYGWDDVWGGGFAPEYTAKSGPTKGSTSDTGDWSGGGAATPAGSFSDDFDDAFSTTNQ